jgi:hypothetical protein
MVLRAANPFFHVRDVFRTKQQLWQNQRLFLISRVGLLSVLRERRLLTSPIPTAASSATAIATATALAAAFTTAASTTSISSATTTTTVAATRHLFAFG